MMILSGNEIYKQYLAGKIAIDPFNYEQIGPNSYDVCLGKKLIRYTDEVLDTARKNEYETITLSESGSILKQKDFYVGHINEMIGSDYYVPIIHAKLNTAKSGLYVHITANLIDIGNCCNFSLHLFPTHDIKVYPGTKIAHVSFWKVDGDVQLYNGKYKGVVGPAASQSFKHAKNKLAKDSGGEL